MNILEYTGSDKGFEKWNWENKIAREALAKGIYYLQYRDMNSGTLYEISVSHCGKSVTPEGNPYWKGYQTKSCNCQGCTLPKT